jgi:hypothetical protein
MPPQHTFVTETEETHDGFQLLQLPETALESMLQQLDPCNLACMAVTCRKLSQDVPASMRQVAVQWGASSMYESFALLLEKHSSSLCSITQCSISGDGRDPLSPRPDWEAPPCRTLPFPQLHHLRLHDLKIQLETAGGCPGVLHGCSGLTALDLQKCVLEDPVAASAAISALPELQSLQLDGVVGPQGVLVMPEVQRLSKLTQLSINCARVPVEDQLVQLSDLSALVNLKALVLSGLSYDGIPGGVPFQLSKLTRLSIQYGSGCGDAEQFYNLSSLTALQDLAVGSCGYGWAVGRPRVPRISHQIQHLSQLTRLSLSPSKLELSTTNTFEWTRLTALENLTLEGCAVQPLAFQAFTQLRVLHLKSPKILGGGPFSWMQPAEELLLALSRLSQLTELRWEEADELYPLPPGGAFTAVTARTNLHSLQLLWHCNCYAQGCVFYKPGTVYPHLRWIGLKAALCSDDPANSEQQLQQLCSCCPAVERLAFRLWEDPSPTACLPLLQLSALTHLYVYVYGLRREAARLAATAAVVNAAAQLTGLKHLNVSGLQQLQGPTLLRLTALTALEQPALAGQGFSMRLNDKVSQACSTGNMLMAIGYGGAALACHQSQVL